MSGLEDPYLTRCENCHEVIEVLTGRCPKCGFDRREFTHQRDTSDEKNKDLTCENRDRPARTGATAQRSEVGGVNSPPATMKEEDSHPNSSDASLEIEITNVDSPEDVDREDLEAIESIQERIEELEEIDFSEVIKPQREAIKLELASLQTLLEAYQSVLETEGGDDDV